jgi:hypothetical protein
LVTFDFSKLVDKDNVYSREGYLPKQVADTGYSLGISYVIVLVS